MKKILINDKELKSLQIVIKYLLDSESKHYEECDANDRMNHIYEHTKIVDDFLPKNI